MAKQLLFALAASILVTSMALTGCGYVAEHTAPKKQPATSRSAQALSADELFWNTLHGADYEHIAPALEAETAAYLSAPNDAVATAHVGWLHIWRLSERQRLTAVPATITDDATLSRKFFEEAVALNPDDARYLGFLASATLAEGSIHQDEAETRRGYYLMLDAIKAYPEFNLFTAGYTMSSQPADSDRYKQALEWQAKSGRMRRRKSRPQERRLRQVYAAGDRQRHQARVLEYVDRPAQLRRVLSQHGRHAGKVRRLANRPQTV